MNVQHRMKKPKIRNTKSLNPLRLCGDQLNWGQGDNSVILVRKTHHYTLTFGSWTEIMGEENKKGEWFMKKCVSLFLSIAIAGLFLGCATLSKNECLESDWFEIGRRDGSMGKPRALFQQHSKACGKHGVSPDREAYYKGRDEGLKFYCTRDNGFEQGRLGQSYRYVCPSELEPVFFAGYQKGRELYQYESKVKNLENRIKSIEEQIQKKEKIRYSSKVSDGKRSRIRDEIKILDLEYRDVARELKITQKEKPVED